MRTGAIFARGSCRALKWMALFGVVFALGAGEALAQTAEWELKVSSDLAEGESLVPVTVNLKVPAVAVGVRDVTVTVTVSVVQLDDAELKEWQGHTEEVLSAMQPPVTRAELADTPAGVVGETAALDDETDVVWLPGSNAETNDPRGRVVGDVVTNADGTATFTFDYGEAAADITHTAYLRTNRDSADAEDELFELEADFTATADALVKRKSGDKPRTTSGYDHPVKIDDAQEQAYVITFPGDNDMTIDEGSLADLELEAVPDRTLDLPFTVTLSSLNDVADYWLGDNPAMADDPKAISQNYDLETPLGTGDGTGITEFTVYTTSTDADRLDDTVAVMARTNNQPGNQRTLVTFDLNVIDMDKLPEITLDKIQLYDEDGEVQTAEVDAIPEGMTGRVTLKADRSDREVPGSEVLTVTLGHGDDSTADPQDYTLDTQEDNPREVEFTKTGTSAWFNVDVDADEDIGMEALVLMAALEGSAANGDNPDGPIALDAILFTDTTGTEISAKTYADIEKARDDARMMGAGDNGLWEPEETLTLMAADLFDYADTANVVLGSVVVEDPSILSAAAANDMVTITAKAVGTSPISITGTVVGPSSLEVTQTTSTAVTVKFPISVDLPMITAMDGVQAVADAAVVMAAADSANGIWEPSPNGAMAMIALSDLFDVPASIEPRYLAESSTTMVGATINDSTMMVELDPMAAGMAMITVTAVGDEQSVSVDFNVEVMAQASVRAMPQAAVDLVFMDAGAGSLQAGGDAVMVDMSMLYEVADGVTPSYSATSDMPDVLSASASGTMLTLTPMSAGNAMIMVEAIDSGSQSIVSVMYDAMVAAAGITYMLSGPEGEDMNLVEGGMGAMLTVTASAAVPADTEVMIMRDRGASTASTEDFMLEPMMVTLMAGEMMGTTMLTATADDMDEQMEELVLFATVDGMEVYGEVKLYIWDAAVPALPLIAQLLLAAFLAIGGYRRYLRR